MAANGLKCYYCDGQSCNATLNCSGDEDRCIDAASNGPTYLSIPLVCLLSLRFALILFFLFSLSVNMEDEKIPMKGCISRLLCSRASVPHVQMTLGDQFSCCEGDFCNGSGVPSEVLH